MNNNELFTEKWIILQNPNKPFRRISVDNNLRIVKFSPTQYCSTVDMSTPLENITPIKRTEFYQAIVAATREAKSLEIAKKNLPIGFDTHSIEFDWSVGIGEIFLNIKNSSLLSFHNLQKTYNNRTTFSLGIVPFININLYQQLKSIIQEAKFIKISEVNFRTRDKHPWVMISLTNNRSLYGKSSDSVDMEIF